MRLSNIDRKKGVLSHMFTGSSGLLCAGVLAVSFMTAPGTQARHTAKIAAPAVLQSAQKPDVLDGEAVAKATPEWGWNQLQRRLDRTQQKLLQTMVVQYANR